MYHLCFEIRTKDTSIPVYQDRAVQGFQNSFIAEA